MNEEEERGLPGDTSVDFESDDWVLNSQHQSGQRSSRNVYGSILVYSRPS